VIRCPDCGSTQVEYPQFSRNTIVGALPAVAAAVGMVEPEFFCRSCHYSWAPAPTEAPPVGDAIS
jgi:transposase-like protein